MKAALDFAAAADAVLAEDLCWLPVRHHSPGAAAMVAAFLEERRPKVVFVEGPVEAQSLIPHLVDAKTRPPVAIYSSFRDDDNVLGLRNPEGDPDAPPARLASWFPFMAYSPELVAIRTAHKIGAEVVFMDLPHWAREDKSRESSAPEEEEEEAEEEEEGEEEEDGVESEEEGDDDDPPWVDALEHAAGRSGFYQSLAAASGFRTYDEAWDVLFETYGEDYDPIAARRDLALFCAAVRATTDPSVIARDGTLPRERHMWHCIQETLKERGLAESDAAVVCGGFHLFLDRDPGGEAPEIPEGTVDVALIPYSTFRIAEGSGYGAGNRAPEYYGALWDARCKGESIDQLMIEHSVQILTRARRGGETLAAADAIAVHGHAKMLSALRDRPAPVLDDLHDAVLSCCCKGDPSTEGLPLRRAMDAAAIGTRVGRVTPDAGQLPLVQDFYGQVESLGLSFLLEKEAVQRRTLDRSDPEDAAKSTFLHRLLGLGVSIGSVDHMGGVFGDSLFKESWRLKWTVSMEPTLIEKNLLGETVEAAATQSTLEQLAAEAGHAAGCTGLLMSSVDMELTALIPKALAAVRGAVQEDEQFASQTLALSHLLTLHRRGSFKESAGQGAQDALDQLIQTCYARASFTLPGVASVPPESHKEVVRGLLTLMEPTLQRGDLDATILETAIRSAIDLCEQPFLAGAFLGSLEELGATEGGELSQAIGAFAQSPPEIQVTAGDFVHGIMSASKAAIASGSGPIVKALDLLLSAVDKETFLALLPRLRAGFEGLGRRQRGEFAGRVAEELGLASVKDVVVLRTSARTAALIAEADRRAAEIMEAWEKQ